MAETSKSNDEAEINVDTYSAVQYIMADDLADMRDRAEQEGKTLNPDDNLILRTLYARRSNVWGLVRNTNVDAVSDETWLTREEVEAGIKSLEALGEIVWHRRYCVLLNWRRWMGGSRVQRDADFRLLVNKGMARAALKLWHALPANIQAGYLKSCGMTSMAELQAVVDKHTNRGGDRTSQAFKDSQANVEQTSSKRRANVEQRSSKGRAITKTETEALPETGNGEGGPAAPPPPLAAQENNESSTGGSRRRRQCAVENNQPANDLTIQVADAFAKAFLHRDKYGKQSGNTEANFKAAASRIESAVSKRKQLKTEVLLRHLIDCVKDNCEPTIHPGNLSSDYTWSNLMPQHLNRMGVA